MRKDRNGWEFKCDPRFYVVATCAGGCINLCKTPKDPALYALWLYDRLIFVGSHVFAFERYMKFEMPDFRNNH